MTSTPLSAVAFLTSCGHFGSLEIEREVAAEFLEPRAALRVGRGADHQRCAHQLADLHADETDARAGALHQQRLASFEPSGGDNGVVHGLQRDRQARRLLVSHVVGRDAMNTARVGDDVLGKAAGRRGQHPVAGFYSVHSTADRFDFAGAFQTEPRAAATRSCQEIGAVEARRARPDHDFVRAGLRLRQVPDFGSVVAGNCYLHAVPPFVPIDWLLSEHPRAPSGRSPNLARRVDHKLELLCLAFDRHRLAADAAGESALRR